MYVNTEFRAFGFRHAGKNRRCCVIVTGFSMPTWRGETSLMCTSGVSSSNGCHPSLDSQKRSLLDGLPLS